MADAGSFLEQAKRDRERLSKPREETFELPGYSTLRVRYGVLSYERELELTQDKLEAVANGAPEADAQLVLAAETLLEACRGFEKFEDDEWSPWHENGEPVKYDAKLANALGIDTPVHAQPRDIVYGVFGGLPQGDRPLMGHYFQIETWMDDAKSEVARKSVGKSGKPE